MPQLNRDQETLYPTNRLHVVFFATSAILVGAIVWMLVGDYVRDWKGVQAGFFRRQAGLFEADREQREAALRSSEETDRALKDLGRKIEEERRRLEDPAVAGTLARLRADLAERKTQVAEADTRIKAVKGAYAERRYAYEMAVKSRDAARAERLAGEVNVLAGRLDTAERGRSRALAEQGRVESEIDRLAKPLKDLQASRDEMLSALDKATLARDDARAKTEESQWRNLPLADIVSPTIKIEKVVLDQIHDDFNFATSPKVDMCMTCHRGIDREIASEPKVRTLLTGWLRSRLGERAWEKLAAEPAWAERTAPGRLKEWLSGSPTLTDVFPADRLEAALGGEEAARAWRDRVIAGRTFAAGGADLLAPFALRPVEWAHPHLELMVESKSPHRMSRFGCTTCHQGVGRRLDFVRAAHTPGSREEEERWAHEHGWEEAEFVLFPMVPARHVEGQCLKCHKPTLEYRPVPEPLVRWEEKALPGGKTELVRAPAPKPVDSARWEDVDGRWRPEVLERGRSLMREMGCTACHEIKGFACHPGWPMASAETPGPDLAQPVPGATTAYGEVKVGPDLTHVKDKTTKAWAIRWIENPTSFRIDTRMPAFYRHRLHDDHGNLVPGADGKPQDRTVVTEPDSKDLAQIDVETLALATFLFDGQTGSRADAYPEPPAGDVERGRQVFYSMGCYACHLGPDDREGSALPEATRKRFERRTELPPGPRLVGLGSKVNAKWLHAWLAEPRHYNSVTRMPNMRWRDETGPDGKTVTRSAEQLRADVGAYLLASKDAEFDARAVPDVRTGVRWSREHENVVLDMWKEWYGKSKPDLADPTRRIAMPAEEADQVAMDLWKSAPDRVLADVGRRLVGYRGCFGCHNVSGYEHEQPIGKELTEEGSQDLHKFDFGILGHDEVPHTRWDWIENKLREPRVYDKGRHKPRWIDKLRMPKFNLTEADRQAIAAVVLGLVRDPIKPGALYEPDAAMRRVAAGRAVVTRYGCNQCHTVENRLGVITAEQLDRSLEGWMLPPNLHGQGNRTKPDWLFRFLKAPFDVRPGVIQRMPMFRLSDAEVAALVDYFTVLSGREDRFSTDAEDQPLDTTPYAEPVTISVKVKDDAGNETSREVAVRSRMEEAKALFDTMNCVKCHLPKGTPGADPNEGASAPPFTLARERLRRAWTFDMIHDPQRQIQGTKMTAFWSRKSARSRKPGDSYNFTYPQFLAGTRGNPAATKDDVAEAQMGDIARYILWHYEMPSHVPPAEPAGGK